VARSPMPRADLWAGTGFLALGAATAAESWRMPRFAQLEVNPWSVPGLVPGLIGVVLLLLGAVLMLRAVREGALRPGAGLAGELGFDAERRRRTLLALLLTLGYAVGLVGRLPFRTATFLFVFAFVALFRIERDMARGLLLRELAFAALEALLVALAVGFVFERLFYVRLP